MDAAAGGQQVPRGVLVLLCPLVVLNAAFIAHHFISPSLQYEGGGGWALQAAQEAEAVASIACSGHGQVFQDGVAGEGGRPVGDPLFMEPYWRRHAAASAVVLPGWHRMSYLTTDSLFQSVELENQIRRLHSAVGNAVVDGKHLVFGTGSTQLINALVHALSSYLSPDATLPPVTVVATAPYYPQYRSQTTMFGGRKYRWGGNTALWANATARRSFIEFVTSPNNPDTLLQKPVLGGSSAIVDHAYYWPHITHIPAPADEDVMLFTMSKLSGHAGSRFGWALIRDENVARRAYEYVQNSSLGASQDTQLRMLRIVKVILANLRGEEDMLAFGHDVLRTRWRRLSDIVSRSRRISLQEIHPQYCTYFNRVREPSPAYAWVKCEREEDGDCYQALLRAKIITRSGVGNEATSRYTRMSLLKSDDDFDVLMERVTDLVDAEKCDAPRVSSM
ncbi:hypothetical protein PR202_ga22126 [Eleusine coracana subsp. coracana]|uniref:Alliinase C-terminal domain-containing protein n=1 Tax=Eleusine coracana subsp. coracana TaxID=191504 RepID=A0AAV5D278_ELECO|nr:hypothetical protein PR202_ga22126 [Eleusine coracana subsp. coracana]